MTNVTNNNNNNPRKIFIFQDINYSTVENTVKKIVEFNDIDDEKEGKVVGYKREPIELIINSPGGYAYSGIGLADTILLSKTPIHTISLGHSMSMAFLYSVVGHKRFASKNTTFMYHEIAGGIVDNATQMSHESDELLRFQEVYDSIIVKHTKIPHNKLLDYRERSRNWYITAEEALKLGIIDVIL